MNPTWLMIALLGSSTVLADPGVAVSSHADLQNSGSRYGGNFNVNQAAGNQSQQTNTRAIAIGTDARATTDVKQRLDTPASTSMNASARIGGSAFTNGNGVLGVNQSAGANNQMANVMRVSISARPQSIDDSTLSQQNVALVPNSGATDAPTGSRQVAIGDQAFTGSRGVIQVNQSAGVGNRMANTLSIRVAD